VGWMSMSLCTLFSRVVGKLTELGRCTQNGWRTGRKDARRGVFIGGDSQKKCKCIYIFIFIIKYILTI
jgi:hypothetical protein